MTEGDADELHQQIEVLVGAPMSASGPSAAPDAVNLPMIHHWVDAFDDRNPVYEDEELAATTCFGGLVAPPAMLQTWTMARPKMQGIAERGGAADEIAPDSAIGLLAGAGFTGTLATNSELEFVRYLRLGDRLWSSAALESVSPRKTTGLGQGYFVTWVTTYTDDRDEVVGRQRFRILMFRPGSGDQDGSRAERRSVPEHPGPPVGEELPPFELEVTPTLVVAGAIASRDFMPVHHDRDYAQAQGAPDIFMNILTTNGYISRYATDWAGSEATLHSIAIRLGGPAVPGYALRFTGRVAAERENGGARVIELSVKAANELGDHAVGSVVLALPNG